MRPFMDAYDAVAYPGHAYPDTHPDRLATIAHLCGLETFDPATCRVLEIGCGDGANLLSLANALPGAELFGVDRSRAAIGRARRTAGAAGLGNVTFEAADLLDLPDALGSFDAILAHGLLSWVPDSVRTKALAICAASLAPHGVAFLSYLALPGNHSRNIVREILRFHVRTIREPAARVAQARAMLRLLVDANGGSSEQQALVRSIAAELDRADDGVLYHDILADHNAAFLFADIMRLADAHGLHYLAEAEPAAALPFDNAPAHVRAALDGLSGDVLLREQYLDFLRYRSFRQTLLVRDATGRSEPMPDRVRTLHAAARVATADGNVDMRDGTPVRFAVRGGEAELRDGVRKALLGVLGAAWPAVLSFDELHGRVRALAPEPPDAATLEAAVLGAWQRGWLDLWTRPPRHAPSPGERPRANALALHSIGEGMRMVSNLRNETIELTDDFAVAVLGLLDGRRSGADVAEVLAEAVIAGGSTMELEGRPVTDAGEIRSLLTDRIGDVLNELAANALLEA